MIKETLNIISINQATANLLVGDVCESVFLISSRYEDIFKIKMKSLPKLFKIHRIVKIKTNKHNLWRRYAGYSALGFTAKDIGFDRFTAQQIKSLNLNNNQSEFELSKGSHICFYWCHPLHSARVAFKLGFLSVVLTIISLIISFIC